MINNLKITFELNGAKYESTPDVNGCDGCVFEDSDDCTETPTCANVIYKAATDEK